MIQRNNNLSVLPFYSKLEYQHRFKPYAFGAIYPLIADANSLLSFQFPINTVEPSYIGVNGEFIKKLTLVNVDTGANVNIYNEYSNLIRCVTLDGKDYLMYTAEHTQRKLSEGKYYIIIELVDDQKFYSEVITLVNNIDDYLKIEWWDEENLVFDSGAIIYNGYKNTLYLDTDIGKPEYKFEEEGKERDGYFFAEKQLSEKVYKFIFLAPEFICDAFRFVRLSDNINIYKNGVHYAVDSLLAEVNWQDQGDLADVSVEFRTGTAVKKIAAAWPK